MSFASNGSNDALEEPVLDRMVIAALDGQETLLDDLESQFRSVTTAEMDAWTASGTATECYLKYIFASGDSERCCLSSDHEKLVRSEKCSVVDTEPPFDLNHSANWEIQPHSSPETMFLGAEVHNEPDSSCLSDGSWEGPLAVPLEGFCNDQYISHEPPEGSDFKDFVETKDRVIVLQDYDVIWGRASSTTDAHPGNIRFRKTIKANQEQYLRTRERVERLQVAKHVIQEIASWTPGGRFLKQETGRWKLVTHKEAMEKVRKALRRS